MATTQLCEWEQALSETHTESKESLLLTAAKLLLCFSNVELFFRKQSDSMENLFNLI